MFFRCIEFTCCFLYFAIYSIQHIRICKVLNLQKRNWCYLASLFCNYIPIVYFPLLVLQCQGLNIMNISSFNQDPSDSSGVIVGAEACYPGLSPGRPWAGGGGTAVTSGGPHRLCLLHFPH